MLGETVWKIQDEQAERCIVGGLMHEAQALFPALAKIDFAATDFAAHIHQVLYTTMYEMWVNFETVDLVNTYARLRRPSVTGMTKDGRGIITRPIDDFGHQAALQLAEVWEAGWFDDIREWQGRIGIEQAASWRFGAAMSAALKVQWLAKRRAAIHEANIALRDALNPVDGPEFVDLTA